MLDRDGGLEVPDMDDLGFEIEFEYQLFWAQALQRSLAVFYRYDDMKIRPLMESAGNLSLVRFTKDGMPRVEFVQWHMWMRFDKYLIYSCFFLHALTTMTRPPARCAPIIAPGTYVLRVLLKGLNHRLWFRPFNRIRSTLVI